LQSAVRSLALYLRRRTGWCRCFVELAKGPSIEQWVEDGSPQWVHPTRVGTTKASDDVVSDLETVFKRLAVGFPAVWEAPIVYVMAGGCGGCHGG
jgi:hypothetical protein